MIYYYSFAEAIKRILSDFRSDCSLVPATFWQSVDVSSKPEMATYEALNVSFCVDSLDEYDLERLIKEIQPNMPWAEQHFQERVGGDPVNPGSTWMSWPYSLKADSFRDGEGKFNHNYMERYWPRYAGKTPGGELGPDHPVESLTPHHGIRAAYGDLWDVLDLFTRDPLTRQAYVPIFFPEDTGAAHRGRVPCTLGYHFIRRNDKLHVNYYIRSCDVVRHFRDDIYLTVRLLQWMLKELKIRDHGSWGDVRLGEFSMFITSLHMFRNDWYTVYREHAPSNIGGINEYSRVYRKSGAGNSPNAGRDGGNGGSHQGSAGVHQIAGSSRRGSATGPGWRHDDGGNGVSSSAGQVAQGSQGDVGAGGTGPNTDAPTATGENPSEAIARPGSGGHVGSSS